MDSHYQAIEAIKKKLVGKPLNYHEIYAVIYEIAHERLGTVLTTYFAAAGFTKGFSDQELYYLTEAMVETGEKLHFDGIVADKHSTGGVPGSRLSMIVVPIVASCGFVVPKNSSRAITTPSGTADTMEVLCPVVFQKPEMLKIVYETGCCIVDGEPLGLARADDVLIRVEEPLSFESYDKLLVAIMAKKVSAGSTHIIFDIPVGKTMKVHSMDDAREIERKLLFLAEKFTIKIAVSIHAMLDTPGVGIGPLLEAKDVLLVLEQDKNRPQELEDHAVELAGKLLDLCQQDKSNAESGKEMASHALLSGKAHAKMMEMIKSQGGNPQVVSSDLHAGAYNHEVVSKGGGKISTVRYTDITALCRILGNPLEKRAGLILHKKTGDTVAPGDILCTIVGVDSWKQKEAIESMRMFPIFTIE
jgi:AMP phosphorylase